MTTYPDCGACGHSYLDHADARRRIMQTALQRAIDATRYDSPPDGPLTAFLSGRAHSGHLEPRPLNIPFIEGPKTALPRATRELFRVFGHTAEFGPNYEYLQTVLDAMPKEDADKARDLLMEYERGSEKGMPGGKVLGDVMGIGSVLGLGIRTWIKKTAAAAWIPINADMRTAVEGWRRSQTAEGKRFARSLGVVPGGAPEVATGAGYDAHQVIRRGVDVWHKRVTRVTGAVRRDRSTAANTGLLWLRKQAAALVHNPGDRLARFELAKYLSDEGAPNRILRRGHLTEEEERTGALEFVRQTEPMPVAKEIPGWMSGTVPGRLLSQYMHWESRIGSQAGAATLDYARAGLRGRAARNVTAMVVAGLTAGTVAEEGINLLAGERTKRGRETREMLRTLRSQGHLSKSQLRHTLPSHLVHGALLAPGIGLAGRPIEGLLTLHELAQGRVSRREAQDRLGFLFPEAAVGGQVKELGTRAAVDATSVLRGRPLPRSEKETWTRQLAAARDYAAIAKLVRQMARETVRQ